MEQDQWLQPRVPQTHKGRRGISALSFEGTVSQDSCRAHSVVVKALSRTSSHLEGSEKEEVLENQEISPSRLALNNLLLPNVPQQPKTAPPP